MSDASIGEVHPLDLGPVQNVKMRLFPLDTPLVYKPLIDQAKFHGGIFVGDYFSNKIGTIFVKGEDLMDRDQWGRQIVTGGRSMDEMKDLLHGDQTTEFGRAYVAAVAGKRFIDLACGDPDTAVLARRLAQASGAIEYVGIDKYLEREQVRMDEFPTTEGESFMSTYIKADMLTAVSQMRPHEEGKVFFLSGIQPAKAGEEHTLAVNYLQTMMVEIQRVTQSGDVIIVGLTANDIHPEAYGFKLQNLVEGKDTGDNIYRVCGIYVRE